MKFSINEYSVLVVTMPDGSEWTVPVMLIARHRAEKYAHEYAGDIERSLKEDTIPLFESDDYEIHDWATGAMSWKEVRAHATQLSSPGPVDYDEGWANGDWEVR